MHGLKNQKHLKIQGSNGMKQNYQSEEYNSTVQTMTPSDELAATKELRDIQV